MIAILKKESRYKKYETVALIKDDTNNQFIVAYHFKEDDNFKSYADTPNDNIFTFLDDETQLGALKQAINKFETIRI